MTIILVQGYTIDYYDKQKWLSWLSDVPNHCYYKLFAKQEDLLLPDCMEPFILPISPYNITATQDKTKSQKVIKTAVTHNVVILNCDRVQPHVLPFETFAPARVRCLLQFYHKF